MRGAHPPVTTAQTMRRAVGAGPLLLFCGTRGSPGRVRIAGQGFADC